MPESHVYSFGCIMWDMYVTHDAQLAPGSAPHAQLGRFPGSTPIGYVLLATSCLSQDPADRPTMEHVVQVRRAFRFACMACLELTGLSL